MVNAASLQAFLKKGNGTLPYPGSEHSSLDLWYGCNLDNSSADEQPPLIARLADALLGGDTPAWKGAFSRQVCLQYKLNFFLHYMYAPILCSACSLRSEYLGMNWELML